MHRRFLFAVLLAGTLCLATPGFAQKWEYLGEANIDGNTDHDRIRVADREGLFRAIRFTVERAPVDFDRVVAHFENGNDVNLRVNQVVRAGGNSRRIDLPGDRRKLESVEIWYQRGRRQDPDKPKVRLFGVR
jgi:hypothetical protein